MSITSMLMFVENIIFKKYRIQSYKIIMKICMHYLLLQHT
jgi:hypothetical protein